MSAPSWLNEITAAAAGGGIGAYLLRRFLPTKVDSAAAQKTNAETAKTEVAVIREVLAEVRAEDAKKAERLDALEKRIEKLEERERHALTRAAVHEAWDRMAFSALVAQNPQHPPPPPLGAPEDDFLKG